MKKTLMLTMTMLLCIVAISSCDNKPEPAPRPEINIAGPSSIEFSGGATDGTVTFTSSEDWTATPSEDWVHVSQTSGKGSSSEVQLTITCDPNPNEEPRTTTVTIKSGNVTKTITITQPGKTPEKVIEVQRIDFEQREYTISVGSSLQLVVIFTPEDATDKSLIWQSFRGVASVSEDGVVKGLTPGYEVIRAYAADGKIGTECIINVTSDVLGSHQGVVTDDMYGGSGKGGDDVSGGSGASLGNEESNKNGFQYQYANHTVNVTEALQSQMQSVSKSGFALPADPQGNSAISNGDVFVFPDSEKFPGGRAMKVTGVRAEGDGYYYNTTLATIDEIFETLHIEQNGMSIGDHIEKVLDESGKEVDYVKTKAGFSISIPEIFGGLNGLSIGFGDNVQISPSAEVSFNLDLAADVVDCKLTYAKAKVNTSARLSADVAIKNGAEKKWESQRFKVIMGAIPIGPVIITPEIYVSFVLKLSGEVNLTFSVNYQKAYYAYTFYDGAGGVHCKAGEAEIPDKKDPFAVTGNISGGVEFGPNLGLSISLYGGALGLSVHFDPHLAYSFTGSLPFTMETLANIGRTANWLSNAFTEPSCSFAFGGSADLAYAWHKEFELPDNIGLSYSFGKTYLMPKLGENLDIKTSSGNMAMVTTTIKNKAWFDDNMYVIVHKNGHAGGEVFAKCPFEIPMKPAAEDEEVNCTAFVRGLDPKERYYVEGPFMTIGAFGYTADLEMSPAPVHADRIIEYFDPRIKNAVKGILGDIYAGRDGDWQDCNWDKDYDNIRNYKNVTAYYDSEGICTVDIKLPKDWKSKNIIVSDHSAGVEGMMRWNLNSSNEPPYYKVKKLEIEDKSLEVISSIIATDKVTIHSPRLKYYSVLGDYDPNTQITDYSAYNCPDIDLSGTDIYEFKWNAVQLGNIKLNDCPRLKEIHHTGSYINFRELDKEQAEFIDIASIPETLPKSLSLDNCPALESITFTNCRLDGFDKLMANVFVNELEIGAGVAYDLKIPDCCKYLSIRTENSIFSNLTISGCNRLSAIKRGLESRLIIRNITLVNCPLLGGIYLNNPSISGINDSEDLFIACEDKMIVRNCPALKVLYLHTYNPEAQVTVADMEKLEVLDVRSESTAEFNFANIPALKSVLLSGNYIGGLLSDFLQQAKKQGKATFPYKYVYEYNGNVWVSTITNDYGFWFPGEPGQHYHFDPKNPNK
ncbi:MAG: Ig-like domain-containing protein [Bacteroidales bacterium]|nr:Ig-like domain-containing protein [Bacteroidales bacterium]